MTMENYDSGIQRTEGGKQIIGYCFEIAKDIGVELINVYWVTDIIEVHERHILSIEAKTGTTEVSFAREELEDYPGKVGAERTQKKVRDALRQITE